MLIHNHHIDPKHSGGDPNGPTIKLTVEEHAEEHRILWEKYGNEFDRIAWLGLSGYIGKEEIIQLKMREGARRGGLMGKGKPKPKRSEHREKIRATLKAKGISPPSREGCKMPEQWIEKMKKWTLKNKASTGYKWYNNEKECVYTKNPPNNGFVLGRLPWK